MTDLPGIVVTGASGRMGQMLVRTVSESDKARLVGAVERPGHDWLGRDIGAAMGGADLGVTVTDDPLEAFAAFSEDENALFLDSALTMERLGRYSFIAAEPFQVLSAKDDKVTLDGRTLSGNPFDLLAEELARVSRQ